MFCPAILAIENCVSIQKSSQTIIESYSNRIQSNRFSRLRVYYPEVLMALAQNS